MTNYESDTATMALVEDIAKYYVDDLTIPATLQQELHVWQSKWKLVEKSKRTPLGSLAVTNMFPNIHTLLCIICTLPVTTCKCERSFAASRPKCSLPREQIFIKNYTPPPTKF